MTICVTRAIKNYELLDSGDGEKLERFGDVIIVRPDPEVLWSKKDVSLWNTAHADFKHSERSEKWHMKKTVPLNWVCQVSDISLVLKIGNNKHVGFFPEQIAQWDWMIEQIKSRQSKVGSQAKDIKILNLFGYTGGASCALAQAGAHVTHVDASKTSVSWAHENKKSSHLTDAKIRFIVDDVRKFVEREIKRGATYDAIVMDPPVYGRGDKKQRKDQMWHIDEDLLPLLNKVTKLLTNNPLFVVLTGYASQYSHTAYYNALSEVLPQANIESGELCIQESYEGRLLPAGIFARALFKENK